MPRRLINPRVGRSADQVVGRGRRPDRLPGVGAGARQRKAGSNCRAGATARPARRAGEVVGIARLPAERAHGVAAHRQLLQIRLGQDQGAGLAELTHRERVARWARPGERARPAGGGQVGGVVVVLEHHRHAVQRTHRSAVLAVGGVHRISFGESPGIHRDQRVQRRSLLVVRVDALEISLNQCPAGKRPVRKGPRDGGDGGGIGRDLRLEPRRRQGDNERHQAQPRTSPQRSATHGRSMPPVCTDREAQFENVP